MLAIYGYPQMWPTSAGGHSTGKVVKLFRFSVCVTHKLAYYLMLFYHGVQH
jgi:hypothetical protein